MGPCFRRDDVERECASAISRHDFARALQIRCPLCEAEGAGNAGCTLHPRSRVPKIAQMAHTSIQVQRKHSGIPRAMALRLTSCSPRWSGLVVTVTLQKLPARLSASIAAPGRADFAVRLGVFVRCEKIHPDAKASIASPALRIVTIAKRPSCGPGCAKIIISDLPDVTSGIFFIPGLDPTSENQK